MYACIMPQDSWNPLEVESHEALLVDEFVQNTDESIEDYPGTSIYFVLTRLVYVCGKV